MSAAALSPGPRRGFLALCLATTFAVVSDAVMILALAWELADTGRAGLLGAMLATNAAVRLVLMPLGGALADRYDKVLLLRVSAVARTGCMVMLAWAVVEDRVFVSIAVMALLGAATAVHYPADRAVVVEIVRDDALARANGTLQTIMNSGNVAGPAIGAAFVASVGGQATFVVAGAGYLCGAVVLLAISRRTAGDPAEDHDQSTALFKSMIEGLWYAISDRPLLALLIVVGVVNVGFLGPFAVGVPALVTGPLNAGPAVLAAIEASFAVGSIVGAAVVALLLKKPRGGLVAASIIVVAAGMAVLAVSGHLVTAVAVMLAAGIGSGVANVVLVTAIQTRTPRNYMGRVMGTVTLMTMGLGPVSLAVAGHLVQTVGPASVVLGGAIVIGLAATLVYQPARAVLRDHP